jgi:hypothetical protein
MLAYTYKLNPGLPWTSAFNKEKAFYTSKWDLNLRKKPTIGAQLGMVLKAGHIGKQIRITWNVLKCCVREEYRRILIV